VLFRSLDRHLIARTTNVYGWDPDTATPNFLMQMARALSAGGKARAPAYLLGNPIQAGDLAEAMLDLQGRGRYGLYHIVGPDRLSRLQWARKLARGLGLEEAAVEAIPAPPVGAVPRPFRVELATDRFRAASAVRPAGVDAGVLSFVAAMRGGDRRT
jgi:dTDP-4-dehydrorhamnose reductase